MLANRLDSPTSRTKPIWEKIAFLRYKFCKLQILMNKYETLR